MADLLLNETSENKLAQVAPRGDALNLLALSQPSGSGDNNAIFKQPADASSKLSGVLPTLELSDLSAPTSTGHDAPLTPGDHKQTLQVDGQSRQFEVHVPKDYDGKSPLPMVYMMHGLTENIDQMKEYSQMNKVADEKGFGVTYLQAQKQDFPGSLGLYKENSWNLDHGTLTNKDPKYDDLSYFKQVKSTVEGELPVDAHKQYLAGFSEGGQAAQYIAHEMPHTFAGIASVHGTVLDSDPKPRQGDPTAMISILGDDDNVLPLKGGHGFGEGNEPMKGWMLTTVPKVSESKPLAQAPAWAAADGDTQVNTSSANNSEITTYSGGSAPVEQIVRHAHDTATGTVGGQHAWDGGNDGWAAVPNPDLIQKISKLDRHSDPDFDASKTVADFLMNYSKP